jgi:uncharacterized membrane protein
MNTVDNLRLPWRLPLVLLAAIGSALSAGIFFAFSTFVMQALGQQAPAAGIATMQSINITVINPWFMAVFFGPGLVGVGLAIVGLRQWHRPETFYWLAGALVYGVGTIGVTIVGNIPLNDALAMVNPTDTASTTLWAKYLTDWTCWNHVRTGAACLAAILFTLSLCCGRLGSSE